MRRLTRCAVPGHGTRCEVAADRPTRYRRTTARRLALRYEQEASQ